MDIKVNQLSKPMQVEQPAQQQQADGAFKFTLVSHIGITGAADSAHGRNNDAGG